MTIENLEKELKENKLNSLYLLYGEELFLLESKGYFWRMCKRNKLYINR